MSNNQNKNMPPCLFTLSKDGGCVGTIHDQCKNCNKRAKAVKEQLSTEVDYSKPRQRKVPVDVVENKETVEEAAEKGWYNRFQAGQTDPTYDNGFIDGANWQQSQSHHTHASFVALVEGEIAKDRDSERGYQYDDGYSDALTDLLNKIK